MLFLAWTILQCIVQCWRLLAPGGRPVLAAEAYTRGIDWLERHCLGLDYEVQGFLPRRGPALIAMKHQSAWETLKLHRLFDDPAVVVKKELLDIPLWGRYAAALRMIPIDRKAGTAAMDSMIRAARHAMEERRCIVIFPEGTRVPIGKHLPYKGGISRLYEATGLPIIPVALNSGLFWPHDGKNKRPGRITLEVLEAVPAGMNHKAALALLEERLETASARLVDTKRKNIP